MDEWYYRREEASFGPITGAILHNLIRRKRVHEDTPVRRADETEWRTAIQVLTSLPPVPDFDPSQPEPKVNTWHGEAILPGAAEVLTPPHADDQAAPEARLPLTLRLSLLLVLAAFVYEMSICISMVLIHLSMLSDASIPPDLLRMPASWLPLTLGLRQTLTALAATMLATAIWQGCAFASLKNLYGDMVIYSRASGFWWIVPVANFFMPLLCLRDLRTFSRARRECLKQHAPFGALLITMEILLLLRLPVIVLSAMSLRAFKAAHISGYQISTLLLQDALSIAFSASIALIVFSNFLQQQRLYQHWNDKAYWDKPRQGG